MQKALLVIVPHLLVAILLFAVPHFTLTLRLLIMTALIISLVYFSRLHLFSSLKKSVLSIKQDSAKNWSISINEEQHIGTTNGENFTTVALMPTSFISNYLIILNFSDLPHKTFLSTQYYILITPDSLSEDEFRRLKVRIRTDKKTINH